MIEGNKVELGKEENLLFDASQISNGLDTDFIGHNINYFDELISTNVTAHELASEGSPEGTAIIADSQTGGKGRRGRSWFSPKGANIYTSVIFKPTISPEKAPQLTLMAAVALAETISISLEGCNVNIKWPNDILVDGKKCAGILSEMKSEKGHIKHVILGIGVNVNFDPLSLPSELSSIATSMAGISGHTISRVSIIQSLYRNLESWYKRYLKEGFSVVKKGWNSKSGMIGQHVRAASASGSEDAYEEGISLGINDNGALLLKKNEGDIIEIFAGDVMPIFS